MPDRLPGAVMRSPQAGRRAQGPALPVGGGGYRDAADDSGDVNRALAANACSEVRRIWHRMPSRLISATA